MKIKNIFKNKTVLTVFCIASISLSFVLSQKEKPVFYIIGDSTVKNGQGTGGGGLWGWGDFIAPYFDTTKIAIENHARGGTSSRTFQTSGLWDRVLAKLKPGDFVIMQFGHNDGSALDDTARARGTIRGTGDESKEIYNPIRKVQEVVYTYGWYMRKFIKDAKAKGATAIICSPIPRNGWRDGKVGRSSESYAKWAGEVAKSEDVRFIDLNELVAARYEAMGVDAVKPLFPVERDATHTGLEGAKLNAEIVVKEIIENGPKQLAKFLK